MNMTNVLPFYGFSVVISMSLHFTLVPKCIDAFSSRTKLTIAIGMFVSISPLLEVNIICRFVAKLLNVYLFSTPRVPILSAATVRVVTLS